DPRRGGEVSPELGEGILGLLPRQPLLALVGLGVLPGMAAQAWDGEPYQGRTLVGPRMGDRFPKEPQGLRWIGPVAVANEQVSEGRQVRRDVTAGGLELARHRDAISVVFDGKHDRQARGAGQ